MITRIISGTIGIALAAYVIQTGGQTFAIGAVVLAVLAWFEFTRAFSHRGGNPTLFSGLLGIGGMLYGAYIGQLDIILLALMGSAVLALITSVLLRGDVSVPDVCISVAGICYIGLPFAHLIMLRDFSGMSFVTPIETFDLGAAMVWVMFIGTWASDSFAYFAGRAFGSHKLAPAISPNKTIEGFLGGLVGTIAAVAGLGYLLSMPLTHMAGLGAAIAILGTLGDLVESLMKRHTGIKDSGAIIPGHGGIWDRFDSVLFTAPLVYYYTVYVVLR